MSQFRPALSTILLVLLTVTLVSRTENRSHDSPPLVQDWYRLAGFRKGKVLFARPPQMRVLHLDSGTERVIPTIATAGGPGRRDRGRTPRPFWAPDGRRFVYRYENQVYVADESGAKRVITQRDMDCSEETRWSWLVIDGMDWVVGPSRQGGLLLVAVDNPDAVKTAYGGRDLVKHGEVTADGRYVVYDDDRHIRVTPLGSRVPGRIVSQGQSCRPCAAPDGRVAWLGSPHNRYFIHDGADGKVLGALAAPPGEEIYRLNWSNDPDYAAHMYGSEGNCRMHVRRISSGAALYIGEGWDPDLWVEPAPQR